jgi:hypothetical protein
VALRTHPSRHDAAALGFLSVAADLIDAYLQADQIGRDQARRLGHITFPSALDWLRTDDVIRLAPKWSSGEAARRRAFFGRWATRDDFLADAVVFALLREQPEIPVQRHGDATSLSQLIDVVTEDLLTGLIQHPRSYLILHVGPLIPRYPQLTRALEPSSRRAVDAWLRLYDALSDRHDLVFRPEWTFKRLASVWQAMLDGFLLQYRTRPNGFLRRNWGEANLLADAVIALLLGAVDWDLSGQSGREAFELLN